MRKCRSLPEKPCRCIIITCIGPIVSFSRAYWYRNNRETPHRSTPSSDRKYRSRPFLPSSRTHNLNLELSSKAFSFFRRTASACLHFRSTTMIASGTRTTLYKSLPTVTNVVTRSPRGQQLVSLHNVVGGGLLKNNHTYARSFLYLYTRDLSIRVFSTSSPNVIQQDNVGAVTKKLRVLDMNVVKRILEGQSINVVDCYPFDHFDDSHK